MRGSRLKAPSGLPSRSNASRAPYPSPLLPAALVTSRGIVMASLTDYRVVTTRGFGLRGQPNAALALARCEREPLRPDSILVLGKAGASR